MKNTLSKFFIIVCFNFIFASQPVFSQQAKINALRLQPSNLIEELVQYKTANPEISDEELAKAANSMLDKQGFNYAFTFDENTCRLINEARKKQKDPKGALNLTASLNSVGGDRTSLALPDEKYECGRCLVYLPVWEASEKDFVTFIRGINVKFHLPPNFFLNEIALVDSKDLTKVVRRWKIPFQAEPLSISEDGKILFLALPESRLSRLVLMVFEEGVIQFYARNNLESAVKGKLLTEAPKDAVSNFSYMKFESGEINQTVRFTAPCGN